MDCRNGINLFVTQLAELSHARSGAIGINLVDDHEYRFPSQSQLRRHFQIQWHQTFLHVHYEQNHISGSDGEVDLFQGRGLNDILRFFTSEQTNAAGIDESKGTALPLDLGHYAIASDS